MAGVQLWPLSAGSCLQAAFSFHLPSEKTATISVSMDKSVILTYTMNSLEGDWSSPENKSNPQKQQWGCPSLQHLLLTPLVWTLVTIIITGTISHDKIVPVIIIFLAEAGNPLQHDGCLAQDKSRVRHKKHPGQTKATNCSPHLEMN